MTDWCEHCVVRLGPIPGRWPTYPGGCAGWAAAEYRGPVRRALLLAKTGATAAASQLLSASVPPGLVPQDAVVTWLPGHPRRAAPKTDGGAALASVVAATIGERPRALFVRSPLGRRQAGRDDAARLAGAGHLGLRAVPRAPASVVIVDDVRTTGASLDHAACLLRRAGATSVRAIVAAGRPE